VSKVDDVAGENTEVVQDISTPAVPGKSLSGFLRRTFAFLIDCVIIVLVGLTAGSMQYDYFAAPGFSGHGKGTG